MAQVLGAVVEEARRRAFVGRDAELASFDNALGADTPRRVLFVHGVGGIGKTALLHRFGERARARGRTVVAIDGQYVDCSPEGLRSALDRAAAEATAARATEAGVLLLDNYQRFAPIDDWFREEVLPSFDAGTVVVLAGRAPPGMPWRTDPGWRALLAVHRLSALTREDSIDLLARAGVADEVRPRLAALGQGHPLTLALLAEAAAAGSVPDDLADAPDLVAALVAQVVGTAPGEAHALGRAACALAWLTTEDLLRDVVGDAAPAVWSWLERQPYVTRGSSGLYPHDLVRDVLEADLRCRSPETYRRVHRLVHRHAIAAIRNPENRELGIHQRFYLFRHGHPDADSQFEALFWAVRERGPVAAVIGGPADRRDVLGMIERSEGKRSAALARQWLGTEPENLHVVRSPHGTAAAYQYEVICPADPSAGVAQMRAVDPVVRAVLEEAARISPARPGEEISIARFLGGAAGEHDPYGVLAASIASTTTWFTRPLAWSFTVALDAEFWRPCHDFLAFTVEFPVTMGALRHTVFGIDWRRLPVDTWEELIGERALTGETGPPPPELLRPAPLDRASFADAIRAALRDLHRPDRLGTSPLMGTALAASAEAASADRLRNTLLGAIGQVGRESRSEVAGRVLDRTFVRAAPTQEAAAEVLDMPFSTYRRHLVRSVERLTDLLWAVEIGEIRVDAVLNAD